MDLAGRAVTAQALPAAGTGMLKERDAPAAGAPAAPAPPARCAGCNRDIHDRFYLAAAGRSWHAGCLRCCRCALPLDAERDLTCYCRDGNIYCRDDYYRSVLGRCARCGGDIAAAELVMRVRELVFHPGCFACAICGRTLAKGDVFALRDGLLLCAHHHCHHHRHLDTHLYSELSDGGDGDRLSGPRSPLAGRSRTADSAPGSGDAPDLPDEGAGSCCASSPGDAGSNGSGSVGRAKRMRTSFKHHQLRAMKSYFALNQNPDAKDLKQLALKTGLSKRVLQVWFQNARAKWRRNMMRQEPGPVLGPSSVGSASSAGLTDGSPDELPQHLAPHPHAMLFSELY